MNDADAPTIATPPAFEPVPIREKFFQASAFVPMPVVLISTLMPDGTTNLAPYSLIFPYIDDDGPAMQLVCRATSKTAANIRRTGRATVCYLTDDPDYLDNCKTLAQPVDSHEKMPLSLFTLLPSDGATEPDPRPELVAEAAQCFECSWLDAHPHEGRFEADLHFVLRVDRILMQPRWREALDTGARGPSLAVDFGFRSPSATWLSSARTTTGLPSLRPRFETQTPLPADEILTRLRRRLSRPEPRAHGAFAGSHVRLSVPEDKRHFWSPQIELDIEPQGAGAIVRGRLGPHPHVWTLFIGMHFFVGMCGLAGLVYGVVQATLDQAPWGVWVAGAAVLLHAFIAGAAFIGQGLGADQTYQLRGFIDDTLAS